MSKCKKNYRIRKYSRVLVAHTYNPSYSGGRDQEDRSSKTAWANSSRDPILKNPIHHNIRSGGVVQGADPEFKPQYCRKKKESENMILSLQQS
jgi:hypothetical protein